MANARVFISYAFVDGQHLDYLFAQRFAEDLRQEGAYIVPDVADVGEQAFVERLNRVLPTCQWLIVIQSPEAMQSLRVQMSVSTALHLVAQHRMQGVLVVRAAPCDAHEVPPAWESLIVFDGTQDYARVLARVLLELGLKEISVDTAALLSSKISSTTRNQIEGNPEKRLSEPPLLEPVLLFASKPPSLEDRPANAPMSAIPLKKEAVAASSEDQRDKPMVISSMSRGFPKVNGWNPRQMGKRSKLLIIALVVVTLLIFGSGEIFYLAANNFNHQPSKMQRDIVTTGVTATNTSVATARGTLTNATTTLTPNPPITTTTGTSIPTPTPVPTKQPTAMSSPTPSLKPGAYLGGVSMGGYCSSLGYNAAVTDATSPSGWYCTTQNIIDVDMSKACQWQYGRSDAVAKGGSNTDMYAWRCYDLQNNYLGGVSMGGYCEGIGYTAAVSNPDATQGWYCTKRTSALVVADMNKACRWQYNRPDVIAYGGSNTDMYSWKCYVAS
jgi:TIR domain